MRLDRDASIEFRLALIAKLRNEGKKQAEIARLNRPDFILRFIYRFTTAHVSPPK